VSHAATLLRSARCVRVPSWVIRAPSVDSFMMRTAPGRRPNRRAGGRCAREAAMATVTATPEQLAAATLLEKVQEFVEALDEVEAAALKLNAELEQGRLPLTFATAVFENLRDYQQISIGIDGSMFHSPTDFVTQTTHLKEIVDLGVTRA